MKTIRLLTASLIAIVSAFALTSCETDIDLSAEYQDITIVYGLLSQNDSIHSVRISKAFLGDGNALEYAKNYDSMSYFNNLEVSVTESIGSNAIRTFAFIAEPNQTEPGIFDTNQLIYCSTFNMPNDIKDANYGNEKDYTYALKIRNKVTGKEITSTADAVHEFRMTTPREGQRTFDFLSENTQNVKWESGKHGRRYDVFIRFWFEEVFNVTDTTDRYFDWKLGSVRSKTLAGNEELSIPYIPTAFYEIAKMQIPYKDSRENSVTARLVNKVEFTIVASGDALNTYLDVNAPSAGISQDKPEYTNVDNGYGIFSTRFTKVVGITVAAQTEARLMAINGLKFVDKLGN